ncbi:MAG: hypothetical protein ABJ251_14060 [Paracoccaceae bacterium]
MIARMIGAAARGFLVALLIATPALVLPGVTSDSTQITLLVALLASLLTFSEYNTNAPSIVEFRDAAPFNRLRFAALFLTVYLLTMICKGTMDPTVTTRALSAIGTIIGNAIDFPFSPVRLAVLMLPSDSPLESINTMRSAAGLAYLSSLVAMTAFIVMVRLMGWPTRRGAFNVWINLPLFDPTAGGDVLDNLQRDARVNIAIGFLLPFIIPAVVKLAADLIQPVMLNNHQTLIWTMSAWAFLPASMIMRGVAMHRIAEMIKEQRRRVYAANADETGMHPA